MQLCNGPLFTEIERQKRGRVRARERERGGTGGKSVEIKRKEEMRRKGGKCTRNGNEKREKRSKVGKEKVD